MGFLEAVGCDVVIFLPTISLCAQSHNLSFRHGGMVVGWGVRRGRAPGECPTFGPAAPGFNFSLTRIQRITGLLEGTL